MEYIELEMSDQDSAIIARAVTWLAYRTRDDRSHDETMGEFILQAAKAEATRVLACKCGCEPKGGHEPW